MKALIRGLLGLVFMTATALAGDQLRLDSNLVEDEQITGSACVYNGGLTVTVTWDVGGGFTGTWDSETGKYKDGQGNSIEFFYPDTEPPATSGVFNATGGHEGEMSPQ